MLSENELLTSPQLSDEQILESVVEQSSLEDESSGDKEDEGQDEKIVSNSEAVECFKIVYYGWKDRTMLTLSRLCSFEE